MADSHNCPGFPAFTIGRLAVLGELHRVSVVLFSGTKVEHFSLSVLSEKYFFVPTFLIVVLGKLCWIAQMFPGSARVAGRMDGNSNKRT